METTIIEITPIRLEWSEWIKWEELTVDARSGGVIVPNRISGVYEVKYENSEERLTIGKATNLRYRIKQGLVKGKSPHSAGKHIREHEGVSRLIVRWACTDRPACAEEELHRIYLNKYGSLPKYVKHT